LGITRNITFDQTRGLSIQLLASNVFNVRKILVAQQQRAGAGGGVVMEGRDIGTVVFPNAELKIFLEATPEARAERRAKEHIEKGEHVDLHTALEEIRLRDQRDTERTVSPLVRAPDAILIDNTAIDVEETARLSFCWHAKGKPS